MIGFDDVGIDEIDTPFRVHLAPHIPYRAVEPQTVDIEPPRKAELGFKIDPWSGESYTEPYYLPLPTFEQAEMIAVKGDSGAGKSTFLKNLIRFYTKMEGRDVFIIEPKNQYWGLAYPNDNPKQLEILRILKREPEALKSVTSLVPINLIQKWGEKFFREEVRVPFLPLNTRTKNLSADNFFALTNQPTKDRMYTLYWEQILYALKKNNLMTVNNFKEFLLKESLDKSKQKSIRALLNAFVALTEMGVICDDGLDAKELIEKASPSREGKVYTINLFGGTKNLHSIGIVCDFLASLRDAVVMDKDLKPVLIIEEAGTFLGDRSFPAMRELVEDLALAYGRSGRLVRIYCFQVASQVPDELLTMSTSIVISFHKTLNLDPSIPPRIGVGQARVELRNMGFIPNRVEWFQGTPSVYKDID